MRSIRGFGHRGRAILAGLAVLAVSSCGEAVRQGHSPSYVIVDGLTGASGARPDEFGFVLQSDVITNVKTLDANNETVYVPTVFEDVGQLQARLALKNPGTPGSPASPTTTNEITLTRYRVVYKRADGRNTPGVDVPYPFDGAITATIPPNGTTVTFIIVRAQAKMEGPLRALRGMGGDIILSTIAEVTFYGEDQAGNEVRVTGQIGINFADWGDPL